MGHAIPDLHAAPVDARLALSGGGYRGKAATSRIKTGRVMELRWLQDFLMVAETGNFTRAAERRNTSPARAGSFSLSSLTETRLVTLKPKLLPHAPAISF